MGSTINGVLLNLEGINYMIPKRVFFYWGNGKMSWMRYMTLLSFRLLNPDWQMIMYYSHCGVNEKQWTDFHTQDFFSFIGEDYYDRLKDLNIDIIPWDLEDNKITKIKNMPTMCASHKSNFLKWAILHDEGGIYSDLDIIYLKPIDEYYNMLTSNNYDIAVCQTEHLSIGFLAGTKGNEFYKDIFVNTLKNYTTKSYQSAGVESVYSLYRGVGYGGVLATAKLKYPHLKFYNNPFNLVYPYGHESIQEAFETNIDVSTLPSNTIAYHWYAGHPIAQKYNNILTENNYKDYNILFCNIAKEIMNS